MRIPLLIFLLIISLTNSPAQTRIPIYRSAADSAELLVLGKEITRLMSAEVMAEPRVIDSLRAQYSAMYEKAVTGYRYAYQPNADYTSYQSLVAGNKDPLSVKQLSISGYQGRSLPSALYECKNLESLELVNTNIKSLPARLKKLNSLRTIALYNNKPEKRLRLSANKSITKLIIRGDKPTYLPANYGKLRFLDTLDLKRNNLVNFPVVHRNKKLKQLNLAENNLTLKAGRIKPNNSLEHLALQRNKITYVPAVIGRFKNLQKLILNYNAITDIHPDLQKLQRLEELGLYSNELEAIPPVVYTLTNLQFLDLYFNKLEKINDEISALQKLTILYMASNRLYSVSDKIGDLKNLRELYLHHNRISALPPTLQQLNQLEVFRVNANHLVVVPEWLTALTNLKNLDISQNSIYQAPVFLTRLSKLELVGLTENKWENKEDIETLADELSHRGVIVHLEKQE